MRKYFDEARQHIRPVLQNPLRAWTARGLKVLSDQIVQSLGVARIDQRFQIHGSQITALLGKVTFTVKYVSDPATHTRREVPPGLSEHRDQTLGHVLATVIAQAFYHRCCAGVAHGETLTGHTIEIGFTARSTVEDDVANQNVLLRQESGCAWRIDDQS